ncbi:MAG: glycosyltransferase family 39 protein [Blastocatellales bacterium]
MDKSRSTFRSWALIVAGSLLVCVAAAVSNAALERALLSDTSRTLGWGATLFRALLAIHGAALIFAGAFLRRHSRAESSAPPDFSMKTSRAVWLALAGLSLLALILRLWRLDTDLWHDEVLTLVDFARLPLGEIVTRFPSQNQHMFFSVLARFSFALFGESAWALRLPSVIFGVGSVWALFLLGRRLLGAREALLACALMTVSYHHIWFSQNARGYMGLLCFTLLATWLWLESLARDEWRQWPWNLGYAVAVALGAWLHLTMAFVAAAHVLLSLTALIKSGNQEIEARPLIARVNWRLITAWALCASLTLQLHALAMPEFLSTGLHEVSLPSEWTNPLWVITESVRSLRIGFSGIAVVLCGGAFVGLGWLSMLKRDWRAGLALVLPAALAGGLMLALGHNLWPRFFFFSMGFALLIVVRGAMEAPRMLLALASGPGRERLATAAGLTLMGLIILASAATVPRNYRLPKQDFTGARDYVERNRQPGDAVVAVGLAAMDYGRYFATHWSVADEREELEVIRESHSTVWLVYTIPVEVKAYHPDIWRVIEQDFEVVKVFPGTLGGGEVYVCRRQPGNANVGLTKYTAGGRGLGHGGI